MIAIMVLVMTLLEFLVGDWLFEIQRAKVQISLRLDGNTLVVEA